MTTPSAETASAFLSHVIASERQRGVQYHVERVLAEGGMSTAYLARRESAAGTAPVVIKVMRPSIGNGLVAPELVAAKESMALGRLNEAVPPTPFVVRYVDSGSLNHDAHVALPWVAIEYVHGGIEGTTLEDRVTYSLHKTGFAFDPARAAHAIRCLSAGLTAIHAVGVIHRDLTPGNVLCCGFGEAEIFKISDFGVARASGSQLTFDGLKVGTLGYAAPESTEPSAGPRADIFSLAGVIYYLLTAQSYIDADTPLIAMRKIAQTSRPSITDHASLSPELLARPQACQVIDTLLAQATAASAALRPQSPEQFVAPILAALGEQPAVPRSSRRLLSAVLEAGFGSAASEYRWTVRCRPREDMTVHSAAWDSDGRALALTSRGAEFWDGQAWVDASRVLAHLPSDRRFVQRYEAGGWLVGGQGPSLSVVDTRGVSRSVEGPKLDLNFSHASGRLDDLLVAVGARAGEAPRLWALTGRRWMKPVALPGVASVSSLQRLDDSRWLIGGRLLDGTGFVAVYAPIDCELDSLPTPSLRAFIGGASAPERALGLFVGSQGVVLRVEGPLASCSTVPGEPDLGSAALDILDREWVTSLGVIWSRDHRRSEPFSPIWRDPTWGAPFVSLLADTGSVTAMSANGGVVEGRAPLRVAKSGAAS